ncbi:hypothetical protein [Kibdelosporangium aridum]|uniref:Uncharacterized protein n=1 Tax=Kibdelosporangium aridum TaxID=2030 RepID=A0A1W2FSW0_KIBAR|nr:hypothetical protein [Kibdelosporangium aridum]SMD24943.1 hypothetical protein SAMN05661093_08816 [Kibdelosporangium aridum]
MSSDDPPYLMALPDPVGAGKQKFQLCMSELLQLVRVHLPGRMAGAGPSEREQRIALRKALGYLDSDYLIDLPEPFFGALLRAAVYDPDPSFNRQFVEPLRVAFGARRTQEALLEVLRTGTNQERAGAARAWYWATLEMVEDIQVRWDQAALREFVVNEDIDVRRCLLPQLPLHPSHYPGELHPLVAEAVHIGRTHPDEYLRHRVELQVRTGI